MLRQEKGDSFLWRQIWKGTSQYLKNYWVDWDVLERSPALIHYKAEGDLFRCAASCSHTLAHCFREFVLSISYCLREFLARHFSCAVVS